MNKDFLYFIEALHQIDKKYFGITDAYSTKEPTLWTLMRYGMFNVEWDSHSLAKLKALRVELLVLGLEVSEIENLNYGYKITVKLPKNPTTELLYGQA